MIDIKITISEEGNPVGVFFGAQSLRQKPTKHEIAFEVAVMTALKDHAVAYATKLGKVSLMEFGKSAEQAK